MEHLEVDRYHASGVLIKESSHSRTQLLSIKGIREITINHTVAIVLNTQSVEEIYQHTLLLAHEPYLEEMITNCL